MTDWHAIEKKEAISILHSSESGISQHEAALRLKKYGKNELQQLTKINPLVIFLQQFKSVFIYILLFAAVFSLIIRHNIDFMVIMIIILLNASIGFFQQYKAEKTIAEMKELLVPKVRVLRNNVLAEILSNEIVPGDILLVSEGDKIMADCRIIHSNDIETNEAVLTGESFSQKKSSQTLSADTELANRESMLYLGTTVVKGNGKALVISIGMQTEFGKIAKLVQYIKLEKTPLEKKFDAFSKKIALIVIILAVITSLAGIIRGGDIGDMILAAIALAVSVIPEGLPAVMAITLALAIGRMQKRNALIRKLPAAETLGRTTVICVDKTGTLTEEEMTVTKIYCNKEAFEIKDHSFFNRDKKIDPLKTSELAETLKIGIMCNNARLEKADGIKIYGDPTEKALVISASKAKLLKKEETEKELRVIEYSFSSKRKLMSIVRRAESGLISYVKGSPEAVLKSCTKEFVNGRIIHLDAKRKEEILAVYHDMASNALRVLGFAYKNVPEKFTQDNSEKELIFVGLQGMIDPPRKEVKNAISECLQAGIKIKMITGDSLVTAIAVSQMIGLEGSYIEARELEKLSEKEFRDTVGQKAIFARITPELKFKIVKTLKEQGEIVAVTGDGVNDILALKEAHIGVAMGIRGTDVARDSSDIILLDDNFASIVGAVREGRRVYDNLKKSIKFHLAANVHELFLVMFALFLAFPLPILPLAILWMNLITDSLPSIALSVEKEEDDIMRRKPLDHKDGLLKDLSRFIIIAGVISFIVAMGLFVFYYKFYNDIGRARTIAATSAIMSELFLVFTCRSDSKNVWKIGLFSNTLLIYSVLGAIVLQMFAIYFAPLAGLFGFEALSFFDLALTVILSSAALVFFESEKFIESRKKISN